MNPSGNRSLPARPRKALPALFITMLLLVAVSPVLENFRQNPKDSFPLSYYPMFSFRRGETFRGQTLAGFDDRGNRVVLSYRLAGSGGFNQIRRQIAAQVKEDRAMSVCDAVARRVGASRSSKLAAVSEVRVISARHRLDDFFRGDRRAVSETVHAACAVPGRGTLASAAKENAQ